MIVFKNGRLESQLDCLNDQETYAIYKQMQKYYNHDVVISYTDGKGKKKVFDPHTNMDIAMHLMKHGYFDIYKNATIEVI